jgi:hypothetical protein
MGFSPMVRHYDPLSGDFNPERSTTVEKRRSTIVGRARGCALEELWFPSSR